MDMSETFIELDRRFAEYRTDETPENQAQRSYTDVLLGREGGMTWDELLRHRLVVILGEPGSGKTQELAAQHERLRAVSFFLPLDRLVSEDDGQRVLRPALKPVAAWLITEGIEPWRLRLAKWILESSPEIHLLHGDPAALPLDLPGACARTLMLWRTTTTRRACAHPCA